METLVLLHEFQKMTFHHAFRKITSVLVQFVIFGGVMLIDWCIGALYKLSLATSVAFSIYLISIC